MPRGNVGYNISVFYVLPFTRKIILLHFKCKLYFHFFSSFVCIVFLIGSAAVLCQPNEWLAAPVDLAGFRTQRGDMVKTKQLTIHPESFDRARRRLNFVSAWVRAHKKARFKTYKQMSAHRKKKSCRVS